jgi:hypothetical protein
MYDSLDDETRKDYVGYIAEEVFYCDPLLVSYSQSEDRDGEDRPEGIDWPKLTMFCIEEIKDLNKRILELEKKLAFN